MTLSEALKALSEGKKIRGVGWDKNEYLAIRDTYVVNEKGNISDLTVENIWELYEEPKPKVKRALYVHKDARFTKPFVTSTFMTCDEAREDFKDMEWYKKLDFSEIEVES